MASTRTLAKYRKQNFGIAFGLPNCPRCGVKLERGKHDPCMRNLPGVVNACCGHGWQTPYATLKNGLCLHGKALETYLKKVGRWATIAKRWGEAV